MARAPNGLAVRLSFSSRDLAGATSTRTREPTIDFSARSEVAVVADGSIDSVLEQKRGQPSFSSSPGVVHCAIASGIGTLEELQSPNLHHITSTLKSARASLDGQ